MSKQDRRRNQSRHAAEGAGDPVDRGAVEEELGPDADETVQAVAAFVADLVDQEEPADDKGSDGGPAEATDDRR